MYMFDSINLISVTITITQSPMKVDIIDERVM
jgi:hypothetical protein